MEGQHFERKLVKDWMTKEVITLDSEKNMMQASVIMKEKKLRRIIIVDQEGKIKGILTHSDLYKYAPSCITTLDVYELNYLMSSMKIKDIMKQILICAKPSDSIQSVALRLKEHKISGLPVINKEEKLVGIITITDVLTAFLAS